MPAELLDQLKDAFTRNDAPLVRELLNRHPEIKSKLNEPIGHFDSPAITAARTREMLDVLLDAGADINARSRWWAGGFGLLDQCGPELAAYAIERGATVDAHSAARLGMIDKLRALMAAQPDLVQARGGDGQTPLHFASTVEVAECLLQHGAKIDARDVDHESTPAQYMVRDRQEIARHLVRRGSPTDLLMASALGDVALVQHHLDADPACIRLRVTGEYFPMINPHAGGTIYQWTLGWYVSAHDVAREFNHPEILALLIAHSPPDLKLVNACWAGDPAAVQSLLQDHPGLVTQLSAADQRHVTHAARNRNAAAVRLMLGAGWPVDALGQHGATPLHWAAFHGDLEMAQEILRHAPPLEVVDKDFNSTPLGWGIYGSEHGWYCRTGNYAGTVDALLQAGARLSPGKFNGTEAVRAVLRRHGGTG